ncbi:mechanosensitive ion channel family protein [Candidatus Saccharibacteria bacterium]|nr:mechanosensitive ion channel family protein [Candidatus Saccharibacteria bacterium]
MNFEIDLNQSLSEHLIPVVLIILGGFIVWQFSINIVTNLIKKTIRPDKFKSHREEKLREETLISISNAAIKVGVVLVVIMLILSELGIDIGPLLAGAGIAGVALGFGAQSMVEDYLSGMFIILENQFRVGDVVRFNNEDRISGVVERITVRQTVLRDLDGMVHHIPNGEIKVATNMTMEYSSINLNVGVGYDTDIDKLEKIINEVGNELQKDKDWRERIIEAPKFERVDDFGDSAITVKILGRTQPMEQWAVTGELRRRLKKDFDKNGIEIPFPQRTIHQPKKSK